MGTILKEWTKSILPWTPLAQAVVLFFVATTYGIARPWLFGHDGWNGAYLTSAARNFAECGLFQLRFLPVMNFGPGCPDLASAYINHPPLFPIVLSLVVGAFGNVEVVARVVSLIFTLGSVAVTAWLGNALYGRCAGIWAAAILLVMPGFVTFATLVEYGVPSLFFILLTFAALLRGGPGSPWTWTAAAFAVLWEWHIVPILGVVLLCGDGIRSIGNAWRERLTLVAIPAAIAFSLLVYGSVLRGDSSVLVEKLQQRAGIQLPVSFTWIDWINQFADWSFDFFGWAPLMVMGIWLLKLAWHRRIDSWADQFTIRMVAAPFALLILFNEYTYIHDYALLQLAPGIALAAAGFLSRLQWRQLVTVAVAGWVFWVQAAIWAYPVATACVEEIRLAQVLRHLIPEEHTVVVRFGHGDCNPQFGYYLGHHTRMIPPNASPSDNDHSGSWVIADFDWGNSDWLLELARTGTAILIDDRWLVVQPGERASGIQRATILPLYHGANRGWLFGSVPPAESLNFEMDFSTVELPRRVRLVDGLEALAELETDATLLPDWFYAEGSARFDQHKFRRAAPWYAYVVLAFPDHRLAPHAVHFLGITQLRSDDLEGAAEAFQHQLEHYPEAAEEARGEALFDLGVIAERRGQRQEAIRWWRQLVTDLPENRWSEFARKKLNSMN